MNRLLSIASFAAAATTAFWTWLLLSFPVYAISHKPQAPKPLGELLLVWSLWSVVTALSVFIVYAFVRYSLRPHWAALLRDTPIPSKAWKGIYGVYLLLIFLIGFALHSWNSSHSDSEQYCYAALFLGCLALASFALKKAFGGNAAA